MEFSVLHIKNTILYSVNQAVKQICCIYMLLLYAKRSHYFFSGFSLHNPPYFARMQLYIETDRGYPAKMSKTSIIPYVNAFVKTLRAVLIRFKVENLPVIGKSFVTIPIGAGAVRLEILKTTSLCVHIYGNLKVIRRDSKVDFQINNRQYTSPFLTKPEDIQELLTILGALLPEAVNCNYGIEHVTKEIESAVRPLLKRNIPVSGG